LHNRLYCDVFISGHNVLLSNSPLLLFLLPPPAPFFTVFNVFYYSVFIHGCLYCYTLNIVWMPFFIYLILNKNKLKMRWWEAEEGKSERRGKEWVIALTSSHNCAWKAQCVNKEIPKYRTVFITLKISLSLFTVILHQMPI
jgi:hypothetical protein